MPPHELLTPGANQCPDAKETPEVLCLSTCPVCGGPLMEIRAKLHSTRCHTICETCCDGGRM
jgi:hypothetical protein